MTTEHPLFIHRYLDRAVVAQDSARFRVRVTALFEHAAIRNRLSDMVEEMLRIHAGIEVPSNSYDGSTLWGRFFQKGPVSDLFTALTLTHRCLTREKPDEVKSFVEFVRRCLSDENLGYHLEDDGSFRYAVDEDFASQRSATLQGLGHPKLASAREHYEAA